MRITTVIVAVLSLLFVSSSAKADDDPTAVLKFEIAHAPALADGGYEAVTSSGRAGTRSLRLASGLLEDDGTTIVTVPARLLATSATADVFISLFKTRSAETGFVSTATIDAAQLSATASDRTMTVPTTPPKVTRTYASMADLVKATPGALEPSRSERDGYRKYEERAAAAPAHKPRGERSDSEPSPKAADPRITTPNEPLALPEPECAAGDCGTSEIAVPVEDIETIRREINGGSTRGTCYPYVPGSCPHGQILAAKYIYGVRSFRGRASNVHGAHGHFRYINQAVQRWQSAVRVDGGGFGVDGGVDRTISTSNASGVVDQWSRMGDCFTDSPECWDGHQNKYGRDSWRWERRAFTDPTCQYVICGPAARTYEVERLFEASYDGGTEDGTSSTEASDDYRLIGYYYPPSSIKAGRLGAWFQTTPGSGSWRHQETESELARSARVSVSLSSSESPYGSASFESSSINKRVDKVEHMVYLKRDSNIHRLYGYDGNVGRPGFWKAHYYSCEWEQYWRYTSNHSGEQGNGCWRYGQ